VNAGVNVVVGLVADTWYDVIWYRRLLELIFTVTFDVAKEARVLVPEKFFGLYAYYAEALQHYALVC
jgi:hypothetical protein